MINKKLVVTGCFALSFVAHAERPVVEHGLIAGASVQVGSYEEDGADSVSPIGGLLSLEKPLTDNFSLRADYAFGLEAERAFKILCQPVTSQYERLAAPRSESITETVSDSNFALGASSAPTFSKYRHTAA